MYNLPIMISLFNLQKAEGEGAGYCLFCGEREGDLPSPYACRCSNCGHQSLVSAQSLLEFLRKTELEAEVA